MPNQKITDLTPLLGVNVDSLDVLPIVDVSANETKKISAAELIIGLGIDLKAPSSGINATAIADGTVTSTEFQYINTVTSNVQIQLDTKSAKLITTNRQTSSYTLVIGDADKLVEMNNASANNLTIPLNATVAYATGTQILLSQYGAGQTTVVATGGVTVRSSGGKLKLTAQYSGATLIKIDTNEWYLLGDITT
jgi:ferric-dicitrate binding protein FerR (iron transport regulator)